MKTALHTSDSTGRAYWRGLDELADTPEFRQWAEREFPAGASELSDPLTRRHFVKIMSASFLLAGLGLAGSGCRRPEEKILPFSKMPENYVHGGVKYFATSMPARDGALPLVVKSTDGRPIKIEGNALFPAANGGTDRFAQASILNLYDPDRARRFAFHGQNATPEAAVDFLSGLSRSAQSNGGQGLSFLLEQQNSPTRRRLQQLLAARLPRARWFEFEPVALDQGRRAAALAFGRPLAPVFHYDRASVIVSLDCDFLGSEENVAQSIQAFTAGRFLEKAQDSMNRLYAVESLFSLTGFSADHRLRVAPSAVLQVAAALAGAIVQHEQIGNLDGLAQPAGVEPKWILECARDLQAHRGRCLVVAGYRQPQAVHLLAYAMNAALGNLGKTVEFYEAPAPSAAGLEDLAASLHKGEVETLVILGGNPAYTAPAELNWPQTQRKAKTVARLGYYEDESFEGSDWHFPQAHYLESWGDARSANGTLVPVQPLIAPLFGGWTELEVLARIGGLENPAPYGLVRETFAGLAGAADAEALWRRFLHDGFLAGSASPPVEVQFQAQAVVAALGAVKPTAAPGAERLEVVFYRDYSVDDGRYNNNGWLQELPDPITKLVWDNAVLLSRKTAHELGLNNSDVVELQLGGRSISGPVWVQPGMADYTVGLALGYGREKSGRVGLKTGFNAYPLRTSAALYLAAGATVRRTGRSYGLATTQSHWSMEGRPIIREANLEQYRRQPDFVKAMSLEETETATPLYPNPFDELKKKGLHQWGMAIDLNRCVGCSACMVACQSENNVPIVGKDQVRRGREMHWLRIDRYYSGRLAPAGDKAQAHEDFLETFRPEVDQQYETWIDNPQAVTQPMLCQHCEAAPCENVCPVNATSHDQEGLNVMTYNRCVGTRYCSNNCPYKVRRFNFFDYNKRPIQKLYWGPLAHREEDELDLIRMIKNPDVTVRMRGVMEKCTFCVQRIEQAKIAQKTKAGASGEVVVPEGTFTTACAQACPAGAIVFGNLQDPSSRVSQLKSLERNYSVLEILHTKPRTTYLARVRNPNPAMPDSYEAPLTTQEFEQKNEGRSELLHPQTEGRTPPAEEARPQAK